jgi:hypothetical protein
VWRGGQRQVLAPGRHFGRAARGARERAGERRGGGGGCGIHLPGALDSGVGVVVVACCSL